MTIIAVLKRKELDLFYDIINSIADSNDTEYLDTCTCFYSGEGHAVLTVYSGGLLHQ